MHPWMTRGGGNGKQGKKLDPEEKEKKDQNETARERERRKKVLTKHKKLART